MASVHEMDEQLRHTEPILACTYGVASFFIAVHGSGFRNRIHCMRKLCVMLVILGLLCAAQAHSETYFVFREESEEAHAGEWAYPVPLEVLEDPLDVLRLINRENLLDKDYPGQNIDMYKMVKVTAPVTKSGLTLRGVVNDALVAMLAGAEAEGVKLYVGSAYRDYRTQEVIHYNRVKRMGRDDGMAQLAGASEHQAGLAADVVSWAYRDGFKNSFADTKEGQWLVANCARYGFILRYPADKEDITGVPYESWHMRYVGLEAAEYIMDAGLTLEEFTAEWQEAKQAHEALP